MLLKKRGVTGFCFLFVQPLFKPATISKSLLAGPLRTLPGYDVAMRASRAPAGAGISNLDSL
jgi:hypothetical protein